MKRVLILGSSLAKYLCFFDRRRSYWIWGQRVKFSYRFFPGKSFDYFLNPNHGHILDGALAFSPDYIIVILGGNSIKSNVPQRVIMKEAREFYQLLNRKYLAINPRGVIVASQILLRFIRDPNNRYHCPDPDEFAKRRNKLNRKILSLRYKHYLLVVAGPGNLDHEGYFRDGTHLGDEGLEFQLNRICDTLGNIFRREAGDALRA